MKPAPTAAQIRAALAEGRERRTHARIVKWQLRAMNPDRSTEERAAAQAHVNRLTAIARDRGWSV